MKSLSNKVADLKTCNVIKKKLQQRCFPVSITKSVRTSILKIICKQLLLPLEVFCIKNLLIFAIRMLHLAYQETMWLGQTIWLQLIYFLTAIAFWPMDYLFRILCVIFIAQISHYGKSQHCIKCLHALRLNMRGTHIKRKTAN